MCRLGTKKKKHRTIIDGIRRGEVKRGGSKGGERETEKQNEKRWTTGGFEEKRNNPLHRYGVVVWTGTKKKVGKPPISETEKGGGTNRGGLKWKFLVRTHGACGAEEGKRGEKTRC